LAWRPPTTSSLESSVCLRLPEVWSFLTPGVDRFPSGELVRDRLFVHPEGMAYFRLPCRPTGRSPIRNPGTRPIACSCAHGNASVYICFCRCIFLDWVWQDLLMIEKPQILNYYNFKIISYNLNICYINLTNSSQYRRNVEW